MKSCRTCERPLPPGHAGGSCPACVFGSALRDEHLEPSSDGPTEDSPLDLGDFELLEELGRGGTGVVYRARQRRLNRIVALKTLHGAALTSRDAFARLQIESQAIARLDHPHIVPLYEVGRHAGTHFLTLRYFQQGSLSEALKARRFAPREAAQMISTAARAIHHAHTRGVLHRDLKPSNFLLDEHGAPHVADFGLAKLSDGDSSLTLSTSVLGTPAYMAPEQATGHSKSVGTSADLYSLGAILFELLTGRAPFVGRSALEVIRLVVDTEPPQPRALVPTLDRDLEAICLRCLEKDPERRYASASALADDLDHWLRNEPLSIRPLSPGERALKWVRRRPMIAAFVAAVTATVALGVSGMAWQWQRARAAAEIARRNAYAAEMNFANRALADGDWHGIRTILDRTRPRPGEEELRGWEWRYLWGVSRSEEALRFGTGNREIASLAALPDGYTVAVGEREGGFSLWDSRSGKQVFEHPDTINRIPVATFPLNRVGTQLVMVPGTPWLAYTDCRGEAESYVRLWNIRTRIVDRSLPVSGVPRDLAASPDGRWLACSRLQGEKGILLFNLSSGALTRTIQADFSDSAVGHPLAFSADSRLLAFESENGGHSVTATVRVVAIEAGDETHRFLQGQFSVVSLAFSPDGRWLASGGGNDQALVRIWDLQSGQQAHTLKVSSPRALMFDPEGRRLFAGLDVWQAPEFTRLRTWVGDGAGVSASCLSGDGMTLLTAGSRWVSKWDLAAPPRPRGAVVLEFPSRHGAFLPDGKGAVLISTNFLAYEALAPRYEVQPIPALGTNCQSAFVLGEAGPLVIGRSDGRVTLHELTGYRQTGELPTSGRPVTGLWWLKKHGLLAVFRRKAEPGNADAIEVWDLQTRGRTWETESDPWAWRWAPSEHDGISYGVFADGRLLGQDLVKHRPVQHHLGKEAFTGASFSEDGRQVLATYWGGQRLLDARTFRTQHDFEALEGTSHGSAIWPDGSRFLLTDCRIIDAATGRLLLSLESPFGTGHRPGISADGSQVLLFSDSIHATLASLWRAPSWEEIRQTEAGKK